MANGILIDEATYFNDSATYTGDSGSSTNMWVIEDCYDFVYAIDKFCASSGDKFVYARLVNDIDLNEHETYKYGFNQTLGGTYSHLCLYGDNHDIRNIVCLTNGYLNFKRIRDCNFINLVSINQTYFPLKTYCYNNAYYIQNCNFGIYMINSSMRWQTSNVLTDCTFKIKGTLGSSGISFYNLSVSQCHFDFDITQDSSYVFHVEDINPNYTRFVNSYITGKIKNVYNGDVTWCYKNSNNFESFCPVNSYFAFEFEQINPATLEIKGSGGFIDGELFSKNGSTITQASNYADIHILTTEDAKNCDYLNSTVGFPVIPVE